MGSKGSKGDKGDKGPIGDKGDRSDVTGIVGYSGPRGDIGDRGDTGLAGPKGIKGDDGPIGPRGVVGDRGDTGPKGIKGLKGDIGPIGPKGDTGTTPLFFDGEGKFVVPKDGKICIEELCITKSDLQRVISVVPPRYINVVNRRPLFNVFSLSNDVDKYTTNFFSGVGEKRILNGYEVYNPAGYNLSNIPPAPGSVRKFRIYAVYSDNLTNYTGVDSSGKNVYNFSNGPIIRLKYAYTDKQFPIVDFKFGTTMGVTDATRDGYSSIEDLTQNHYKMFSVIPDNATTGDKTVDSVNVAVRWYYIELQALDVFP